MDERVRDVVRGKEHWTGLRPLGVSLQKRDEGWTWTIPAFEGPPFMVATDDLAAGLNAWEGDGEALREWAAYLVADTSLVSFDELEKTPNGENILDALRDLMFGEDAASKLRDALQNANP